MPEVLELKRKVWGEVDKLVGTDTILGTSTSCIGDFSPSFHPLILLFFAVPSKISDFMEHKAQFIVAHPCNPPYHTPMVELVPAPWTSTEVRVSEHFSFYFCVSQVPLLFIFIFFRCVQELEPLWLRLGKAPSASQGRCLGLS